MNRIERRLTSCSSLLSLSGRLEMVNSMVTPITTYAMCTFKMHKGVIENVGRGRKQCLWRGNDLSKKGGNLAAWPLLIKPKKGGLGTLNLSLQNDSLLLKHLHKFYSKQNIHWVNLVWSTYYTNKVPHVTREVGSFLWKDVFRPNNLYRGVARCHLGDGSTATFWWDPWHGAAISELCPRLFSLARDDIVSVKQVMEAPDLDTLSFLPLSVQAHQELIVLQEMLKEIPYDADSKDNWIFFWENGSYTSSRMYKHAFSGMVTPHL